MDMLSNDISDQKDDGSEDSDLASRISLASSSIQLQPQQYKIR